MTRKPPHSIEDRRAALAARHPRLARPPAAPQPTNSRANDSIILGIDDDNRQIRIDDRPRVEHTHVIGATGCGKSTFLLNCILQDIARGRGVCVLDPHGGHPDSLINSVLRFLDDHRWIATRKVHIIAPNVRDYVVGFNPLAPLPGTDPSVIAGAMLTAFERVWGNEDTLAKPTTRKLLRTLFTALSESGLTIPDAQFLLDYEDAPGFRRNVITRTSDEFARHQLELIEQLSRQPRSFDRFQAEVIGPLNRLAEFTACEAIRTMLGMTREQQTPDRTIDILDIMDRGEILLVDLQHGRAVDETATDLLGKIILRYLFMLMTHRKPYVLPGQAPAFHPVFVYVDECHRYMTDDAASLLFEARKYGIGVTLAHQYLAQLGKPGDKVYESVRNSTEIKAVFRVKSADEAQALAHDVIPLDLELPVAASVRPVQVGFTVGRLSNDTYSVHEGEGEAVSQSASQSVSRGRTAMQSWMQSFGRNTSTTYGSGTATSFASGASQGLNAVQSHMDSMAYSYDPNTQTFIGSPMPNTMNVGFVDGTSTALMSATNVMRGASSNEFQSTSEGESFGQGEGGALAFSEALANTTGRSDTRSRNRGTTTGSGSSEALIPRYENLPTSFHSKDNALYMAGETIRVLPVGRAIVRFRGTLSFLNVPPPRKAKP